MIRYGLRLCLLAAVLLIGQAVVSPLWAVEPAREFLEALRERGYYDVAIDYLDQAQDNPAVPVQFKETLPYERGVTLVVGARAQRDSAVREKWLDDGQKVLTEFVTSNKESPLAFSARRYLGNVLVERARTRMKKSEKLPAEQKLPLFIEARALYSEAKKVFDGQVDEIRERLKAYPASITEKSDPKRYEEREFLRRDFLEAQILSAATLEELAETFPKGAPEQAKAFTDAADAYKKIYENYRTRLAGLYARLYQARCLQKLGKHKEAIGFFTELLSNPDAPDAFHTLKAKTIELAIDSWMAEKLYKEIMDKAFPYVDQARANEDKTEEFMIMRVKIAKAAKIYADELKTKDPKDPIIKKLLTAGRKLVTEAAKANGSWQDDARKMIADFTGGDVENVAAQKPDPKTFLEARTAGKDAVQKMQDSELIIKQVGLRLPTVQDAAERAQMQGQIDEAKKIVTEARADAAQFLRVAIKLADKDTPVDDLNLVRYLVCYLAYAEGNYYDAIVMGEFIAQRYPDSQGARQCAKIAMAGYLKLYTENKSEDKTFESQQIENICDYIVQKWPDQPEAEEALNTLIPFMIRNKNLPRALAYLAKIPADSPHRGNAELKTGQAMWAAYLEGQKQLREWGADPASLPEGTNIETKKTELDELKTKAKSTLADGVARMQASGEVTPVLATAVLSLAQIYVDTSEAGKAVALLEEPKIGTLTLVQAGHDSTKKEGFAVEAYKTGLRAYISALASSADADATIKKAKAMMDALKASMGANAEGQAKLVAIYVSLARDLQTQMELADPKVKSALGKGFEVFLKQVAEESSELNVLNWVAETYRGMGESFLGTKKEVTVEAAQYLGQALETYKKILEKGKSNKAFMSPGMSVQIRLQTAKAYRTLGKYKEAVDTFEEILKTNPTMLPVQVEAAHTYQNWGMLGPKFKDRFNNAIVGARPDKTNKDKAKQGKNVIWGWGEIAKMTAGNPKYSDQFHEARYNLAFSRYNWALAETGPTREEVLKRARQDIAITVGSYKDLGGPKWETQYDALMKKIEKALGVKTPGGIAALKPKEPTVTPKKETAPKGSSPTVSPKTTTTSAPGKPAVVKPAAAPVKGAK